MRILPLSVVDHPRIRGEHRQIRHAQRRREGIIPAYAGNTHWLQQRCAARTGSSPHTRGTQKDRRASAVSARDHPRIRGEHTPSLFGCLLDLRIIPAYAGNTRRSPRDAVTMGGSSPHTRGTRSNLMRSALRPWDHPRIRGEHVRHAERRLGRGGIIPAYAGNTWPRPMPLSAYQGSSPHTRGTPRASYSGGLCRRDHPRIRGEHTMSVEDGCIKLWIIPAYAGNTLIYLRSQFPAWQFCITLSKATGLVPLTCIAPA